MSESKEILKDYTQNGHYIYIRFKNDPEFIYAYHYKKNGDVEKEMITKKEYLDLVNSIEADNSECVEDLRIIPHLDFSSDGKVKYYHYVTEESYQKYLITQNEGDLVIKGEGAF